MTLKTLWDMSEWKEYILEDVIEKFIDYRGKTPNKTISGIPLVTAKIVKNGRLLEPNEFIACEDYESWMTRGFPEINDVVLTSEAPLGEVALIKNKNIALAQRIITLQTKKKICNSVFLKYYLQSSEGQASLQSRASGSTVEGIKSAELKKLEISLPPLPEQTAIASILSSLDDKIDLLHRQNTTLEKMAETLFRQWFVEEAKEEWEFTTLDKHTEAFRGLSYKGSGLTEKGMGLPMHNLNSVKEGGGYKFEGIKYYSGEYRDRHLIRSGDIIVTNTEQGHDLRLIGFPAIVPDTYGSIGLFSQHIYKLALLKGSYLTKEFIYHLLMIAVIREQITSATNGSTVNMLAIDGLQRPEFKLPPKSLVDEFTTLVSGFWKKKNINQTQIRTLTAMRDNLLPKLMSGEVRVEI
jgi:type I restriction enzyme, S subunit